jgi:hypothetical protein
LAPISSIPAGWAAWRSGASIGGNIFDGIYLIEVIAALLASPAV